MSSLKVIIAGGSGLVGTGLSGFLKENGYDVTILSRSENNADKKSYDYRQWDGCTLGEWTECLDGALAVINLAGRNVNCRLTKENRQRIFESRISSTKTLIDAARKCSDPPSVFIQASAVGYYGNIKSVCDENSPAGNGFLADVCRQWEMGLNSVSLPGTRKVIARLGVVLSSDGGAFPLLKRLVSSFMGGYAGSGSQYISWIHEDDVNRVFKTMIEDSIMDGIYNVVSPVPLTNADFMKTLRAAMSRPWSPPVPALFIKLGAFLFGSNAGLVLGGQNTVPLRLMDKGFEFRYDNPLKAMKDLCGKAE